MKLQPGQSPPLAVITPNDQRGVVFVTGGLALAMTLVCLVVRAYVRVGLGQVFASDDYAIAASFLFMIAQCIALFAAASYGLGETSTLIPHLEEVSMQKAILATDILYIFALWSSRCSSALFYLRLSRASTHERFWKAVLGAIAVFGVVSLLTIALRCDLDHAWLFVDQHCTGIFDRWLAVTVFGVLFEITLFAHPLYVVANLQMATKIKIKIISAFAGRLVVIAPLILHLLAIPPFYELTDDHPVSSYNMTRPYIYTQISLALAIITPTIPLLQPFVQATSTAFGMVSGEATNSYCDPMSGSHSRNGRSNQTKKATLVGHITSSRRSGRLMRESNSNLNMQTEEENLGYSVSVVHDRRVSNSGSDISQQPMIRHDVQYAISYSQE